MDADPGARAGIVPALLRYLVPVRLQRYRLVAAAAVPLLITVAACGGGTLLPLSGSSADPVAGSAARLARIGLFASPAAAASAMPLSSVRSDRAPAGRVRLRGVASPARLPRAWRGLAVRPPDSCAYDPAYYRAPRSWPRLRSAVPGRWRELAGCALFEPGGRVVEDRVIVPRDAHAAGLCGAPPGVRVAFARDPDNRLFLPAAVALARRGPAPERPVDVWLLLANRCWYIRAQVRLRRRYGLSVAAVEVRAFAAVLSGCPAAVPTPSCRPGAFWDPSWR